MSNINSLRSPNGSVLTFHKSVFNKKQKSFDIMFNNGIDNNWYKIGIIRDIKTLNKFFESEEE